MFAVSGVLLARGASWSKLASDLTRRGLLASWTLATLATFNKITSESKRGSQSLCPIIFLEQSSEAA